MSLPLEGRVVALAETRQLEELAAMLQKEGATPLRVPMVAILDAPDPAPVVAWVRELVAGKFRYVVLMTGEGVRRLLSAAEGGGLRAELVARMAAGSVDLLVITSSPQVDRLFEVASQRGLDASLKDGLAKTRVAAVGPVAAHTLERHGVRVDICPDQGFVMKKLVQLI